MSLLTRKQFSDISGLKLETLNVYISRKQVLINKAGKIDTSNPDNALLLENREKRAENSSLNSKKKKLEIEKVTREIALLKIKESKLSNEVLPIELVKPLIQRLSQAMLVSFKDAWEDQMDRFNKKYKVSLDEVVMQRRAIIQVINASVERAREITKKEMKIICENYSNKVGRGERKP